jgi:hypothetical protein
MPLFLRNRVNSGDREAELRRWRLFLVSLLKSQLVSIFLSPHVEFSWRIE